MQSRRACPPRSSARSTGRATWITSAFEAKAGQDARLRDCRPAARLDARRDRSPCSDAGRARSSPRRTTRRRPRPRPGLRRPARRDVTPSASPTPSSAARGTTSTGSAPGTPADLTDVFPLGVARRARHRRGHRVEARTSVGDVDRRSRSNSQAGDAIALIRSRCPARHRDDRPRPRPEGRRRRRAAGVEAEEQRSSPRRPTAIATPGGASGRIERAGRRRPLTGSRRRRASALIVEVFGRRLGSPIDPVIEILDAKGQPVPRAVLRPVEETNVAFRDHASIGPEIRLTQWNDFARRLRPDRPRADADRRAAPQPRRRRRLLGHRHRAEAAGERLGVPRDDARAAPAGPADVQGRDPPARGDVPHGRHAAGHAELPQRRRRPGLRQGQPARPSTRRPTAITSSASRTCAGSAATIRLSLRRPRAPARLPLIALSQENPNIPRGGTAIVQVERRPGSTASTGRSTSRSRACRPASRRRRRAIEPRRVRGDPRC